ncbi:MAG: CsbD family protein [Gemmatimonadetes bacterium]|nr:CsbD family protein [Gemmatimonadota bacterium]
MKPSTRNQAKGEFHHVKGQLKAAAGKLGNDRELEVKGKFEKGAGKAHQKIGQLEKLLGR